MYSFHGSRIAQAGLINTLRSNWEEAKRMTWPEETPAPETPSTPPTSSSSSNSKTSPPPPPTPQQAQQAPAQKIGHLQKRKLANIEAYGPLMPFTQPPGTDFFLTFIVSFCFSLSLPSMCSHPPHSSSAISAKMTAEAAPNSTSVKGA